jgi:transcriptional antiterminator NusG
MNSESVLGPQDPREDTDTQLQPQPQTDASTVTDGPEVVAEQITDAAEVAQAVSQSMVEPGPAVESETTADAAVVDVIDATNVTAQSTTETPETPETTEIADEVVEVVSSDGPATISTLTEEESLSTAELEAVTDSINAVDVDSAGAETQPRTDESAESAAEATAVGENTETVDEDFVIAVPKRKRAAKANTSDKPKAPRKTARTKKAEKLPDPGDGSGYEAPQTAEGTDATEDAHWYAVHCYSGYENKVKHNLEQRIETMGMAGKILEVVVPTEDEIEVRDGKRRTVERRVFPGYVMVHMKMSEESWHVVRNTPGVTRFIGMGNRPQPLSQQEVNQIVRRMEAEAPKIKVNYRIGQKVRITDGPFADFMGLVDKIDTERAKVSVLVSFFGRETPVELDFLQVEKM